jgi:hypothetical protein
MFWNHVYKIITLPTLVIITYKNPQFRNMYFYFANIIQQVVEI